MTYQLMVCVPPGINKHHPAGGWFKNLKSENREELQRAIYTACQYEGNTPARYRIDEVAV